MLPNGTQNAVVHRVLIHTMTKLRLFPVNHILNNTALYLNTRQLFGFLYENYIIKFDSNVSQVHEHFGNNKKLQAPGLVLHKTWLVIQLSLSNI